MSDSEQCSNRLLVIIFVARKPNYKWWSYQADRSLVSFLAWSFSGFDWIALKVISKGRKFKIVPFLHFSPFSHNKLVSNFFSILAWTLSRMVLINYPNSWIWLNRSKGHLFKICLVTFSLFWHEASPGWWQWTVKRRIWLTYFKGHCQGQKG